VLNLHVTVAERQVLGTVHEREVAKTIKAILDEQGAFPRPRSGKAVFEGAVIAVDDGLLEILGARICAESYHRCATATGIIQRLGFCDQSLHRQRVAPIRGNVRKRGSA
jgi:hypothetical protein